MEGSGKPKVPQPESWWSSEPPDPHHSPDFDAPPHHQQPAAEPQAQPRSRLTAQNLPPPTIFLLVFGFFGLFVAFSSWQKDQHKQGPIVYSTSSATVHQVVPPSEETPATTVLVSTTVVQTVTVETTETKTLTEKVVQPTSAVSKTRKDKKDRNKDVKTQEISTMSSTEQT
jgi:hypothetical protein